MPPRNALALVVAIGVLGCGARAGSGRGRVWTLFDLVSTANVDGRVAVGSSILDGFPASYFVRPSTDADAQPGDYRLAASHGFLDHLPMAYVTTEVWANVDEIWAQPLYRALNDQGAFADDVAIKEPWVFGVGPRSHFYSPFWEVFGFRVPAGTDVTKLLDTRSVLEAANQTGGVRWMERRITSLGPPTVEPPAEYAELSYYDDSAAWDGVGDRRYLDLGPGRFDTDADAVVREVPMFVFASRNEAGQLEPLGDRLNVGGTHPLFSTPPSVSITKGVGGGGGSGGGASSPVPTVDVEPDFGGLWRIYLVELPTETGTMPDGRVVVNRNCLDGSRPCIVLDSQAAIESLGAARIRRTELLVSCPLLQLGDQPFPKQQQPKPQPEPP